MRSVRGRCGQILGSDGDIVMSGLHKIGSNLNSQNPGEHRGHHICQLMRVQVNDPRFVAIQDSFPR